MFSAQPLLCRKGPSCPALSWCAWLGDMDLPQSSPSSRALSWQRMARGGSGRILPHLWPSSSRVSFFHFPAKFSNSSAETVPRREHAQAAGFCLQLRSQMYLGFLFKKKPTKPNTTLRQQGRLSWRLCKTCVQSVGKAVG